MKKTSGKVEATKKIIAAEAPTAPTDKTAPRGETGQSGTSAFSGIITEEYLGTLNGTAGITIYDKMRKSDATVRAILQVITLPIRRANWFVEPASQDPADVEAADFVKHSLFDWMTITWDDFLRQALLMLPYGCMLFEKVFDMKEFEGKTYLVWKKLAPRLPKSIQSWQTADHQDGVQQYLIDGKVVSIPMEKLVVFVNEKEGDNWWGTSVLRAAYKSWYYKTGFEHIDSVAFERQGLGVPYAKMPTGYSASDEDRAASILQNMRAHDKSYVIIPQEYDVGFLDMKATSTRDPRNSIAYHNREITKSVLAQFLELGSTNIGSRALSTDQTDLFLQSIEAVANAIKDVMNKYAVQQLVDFNFNVQQYPKLVYNGISRVDADVLSTAYQRFTQSKGIVPSAGDEKYFREMLGLPERDPDEDDVADPQDVEDQQKTDQQVQDQLQQSEIDHRINKLMFAEGDGTFKPWRKMTFAEKKVNWPKMRSSMDDLEKQFLDQVLPLLQQAKDDYVKRLTQLVNSKDTAGIRDLELKYQGEYRKAIKEILKAGFTTGKLSAAGEMKVSAPANPNDMMVNYDTLADAIVSKQAGDIVYKAKQGLVAGMSKGESVAQTIGAIDADIEAYIKTTAQNTGSVIVGESIGQGRDVVFTDNADDIHALQRSELLDAATCNFCLSMDGRIIPLNDKMAKVGTYHSYCRGMWVEIMKGEEDLPKVTGVPKSIRDRFGGGVNELVQPTQPILRKDSLADQYIQRNK